MEFIGELDLIEELQSLNFVNADGFAVFGEELFIVHEHFVENEELSVVLHYLFIVEALVHLLHHQQ